MESHLAQDCLSLEYVPRSFNRDLMIALLSQFGEIADIQMHYNHSTEIEFNGFGSGFVRFSSYDQAARAMRELNGFRVHGHPLRYGFVNIFVWVPPLFL